MKSKEDVLKVLELFDSGISNHHEIARQTGVRRATVQRWISKYVASNRTEMPTRAVAIEKKTPSVGNFICSKCKLELPNSNFYPRRDKKYHPYCKSCATITTVSRGRSRKKECVDYKGGECEKCGYSKCISALQFHHRDPNEKDFTISQHKMRELEELKPELDKCTLLCSRCHAELHGEINDKTNGSKSQRNVKKALVEHKGGKCELCAYSNYVGALHFHHLDPSEKSFGIAELKNSRLDKALPELEKCAILCVRCHQELHAGLHNDWVAERLKLRRTLNPSTSSSSSSPTQD